MPFRTFSSKSSPYTVTNNSLNGFVLCTPATNIGGGLGELLFAFSPPSWSASVSASNLFVVCGSGGFSQESCNLIYLMF